ncbi:MAG: class I SAM-dependent methyltransferase [Lachnospiraceae bacterium]|jgi:ubiquinone/menaquinone biosynthesis C-methylase UbiE|nr:class I SAM-dependent methyltransferase [Lachnospiraceae bacterium]
MRDMDEYYKKYTEEHFEGYLVKYRRKKEIAFLNKYNPANVLEIGCGMEPIFEYWNLSESMTVVEPQKSFFQNAYEKAQKKDNVKVIHKMFQDAQQELKQEQWDVILCSGVLGEVIEPESFLKDVFNLCGKKTRILIITSNAYSFHRILGKEMGVINDVHSITGNSENLQQLRIFDKQLMRQLVENCGGVINELSTYFIKPFTHTQMYACLENNIFTDQVLEGLWNMSRYLPEYGAELYCDCGLE